MYVGVGEKEVGAVADCGADLGGGQAVGDPCGLPPRPAVSERIALALDHEVAAAGDAVVEVVGKTAGWRRLFGGGESGAVFVAATGEKHREGGAEGEKEARVAGVAHGDCHGVKETTSA